MHISSSPLLHPILKIAIKNKTLYFEKVQSLVSMCSGKCQCACRGSSDPLSCRLAKGQLFYILVKKNGQLFYMAEIFCLIISNSETRKLGQNA